MLGRMFRFATVSVLIGCFVALPARAQNLEAGKSPAQIFSGACAACHKSTRGLVKTVPPGSLPNFLRQHYTTSSDMARALSAYLMAHGGVDRRQGEAPARRGRRGRPDPREQQAAPPPPQPTFTPFWMRRPEPPQAAEQEPPKHRRARKPKRAAKPAPAAHHGEHEGIKTAPADESAKPQGAAAEEAGKTPASTHADPVPPVTPAPKSEAAPSDAKTEARTESKLSAPGAAESKPADASAKPSGEAKPASGDSETK